MRNLFCIGLFILLSMNVQAGDPTAEVQFAIMGDAGRWNSNSQTIKDSMQSYGVSQLVMPGDNLYEGTYEQAWGPWRASGFNFEITAIGNHNDGYKNEMAYFDMPGEFFSKTYLDGKVQYLVLNSDNEKNVDTQMRWLEQQLITSTATQIYLMYHHPSLKVARHNWTEKRNFQVKLRALIKKYRSRITALVVGHDHIAALMHFDNMPVIISGSTQKPRNENPINNVQEGIKVRTDLHYDTIPYWVLQDVSVESSDFVFIRAHDGKEMCRVTIQTGQPASFNCPKSLAL